MARWQARVYLLEQVVRHGCVTQAQDEAALTEQVPCQSLRLQPLLHHLLDVGGDERSREHDLAVELELALAGRHENMK